MVITILARRPSCSVRLRRVAELWLPKTFTGDDGDILAVGGASAQGRD